MRRKKTTNEREIQTENQIMFLFSMDFNLLLFIALLSLYERFIWMAKSHVRRIHYTHTHRWILELSWEKQSLTLLCDLEGEKKRGKTKWIWNESLNRMEWIETKKDEFFLLFFVSIFHFKNKNTTKKRNFFFVCFLRLK